MGYIFEVSKKEAYFILTAFHRFEGFSRDNSEMCSHFHEEDFICKNNNLIQDSNNNVVHFSEVSDRILKNIAEIAGNSRFQEYVTLKLQTQLMKLHSNQVLLWMSSLLTNFHHKSECSEFLTLALKFKLYFYWNMQYFRKEPATILDTMLEIMEYTVDYKCSPRLFSECLDLFIDFKTLKRFQVQDYFYPVLHKVLKFAHEHRINIFNASNVEQLKYYQLSLLQNLERFLLLTKYGYEDRFSNDIMEQNILSTYRSNKHDLFGIDTTQEVRGRQLYERDYRPLQVLVLYLLALRDEKKYGKDMYSRVLYIIWQTIPDPYLTLHHFLTSFKQSSQHIQEFLKVWLWYSNIVLGIRFISFQRSVDQFFELSFFQPLSPRSLKHLSRCSIRRTLTASAQLPSGVAILEIPETLKTYLKCGMI